MRNKSLLLCLALAGALAAVSCKPEPSKGDENGGNGGEQGEITYPFSVNEKISGTFKAGVHDAVVIEGDGFRAGLDSVAVIWQEEGDDMFETVKVAVTVSARQLKFGVYPGAPYVGIPVKIGIKNDEYGPKPVVISDEVTFTKPTLEEGWIDDWGFRHAGTSHLAWRMTSKRVRKLRGTVDAADCEAKRVLRALGHAAR